MDKLFKEVQNRIDYLDRLHDEEVAAKNTETKVFTVRLPVSVLQELDDIAMVLQMTRTDVTRMILTHGAEAIKEKFKIKVERGGVSFSDMIDFENGDKVIVDPETGKTYDASSMMTLHVRQKKDDENV